MFLEPDEPPAPAVLHPRSDHPLVLLCEHASNRLPRRLGDLGLREADLGSHIAWDIGALGVAQRLADRFGAALVRQAYSRLAVDCNRSLDSPALIAETSAGIAIPGNRGLGSAERAARIDAIWRPYQDAVHDLLAARKRRGVATLVVAIHSFTPIYLGTARPWHVGFLSGGTRWVSEALHARMGREPGLVSALDEPYRIEPDDYSVPMHGDAWGWPSTFVEIRNDLVGDAAGQQAWADRLGDALQATFEARPEREDPR
ncbi:MAG: N-formylglutamate amidohydrolase [Alphaproteobacteria bacterium]|nr:N-formylglutamate amidohydrolase [Alphaproteobacteria bacterium]